jgi:hypothetical protein
MQPTEPDMRIKDNHCSNASHNSGAGSSKFSEMEIGTYRNGNRAASSWYESDGIGDSWAIGLPLRLMMMVSWFVKTSSSKEGSVLRVEDTDIVLIQNLLGDLCVQVIMYN